MLKRIFIFLIIIFSSVFVIFSSGFAEPHAKYLNLSELNGKPVGVQTGIDEWGKAVKRLLPDSEIIYYHTFADLMSALNSHKIEGFIVDEPVFNLMSAENKNLAKIDEKIAESYYLSFAFPKTDKGKKLNNEMNEFLRLLKADGELDKIIAKWEGADEAAINGNRRRISPV